MTSNDGVCTCEFVFNQLRTHVDQFAFISPCPLREVHDSSQLDAQSGHHLQFTIIYLISITISHCRFFSHTFLSVLLPPYPSLIEFSAKTSAVAYILLDFYTSSFLKHCSWNITSHFKTFQQLFIFYHSKSLLYFQVLLQPIFFNSLLFLNALFSAYSNLSKFLNLNAKLTCSWVINNYSSKFYLSLSPLNQYLF